MKKRILAMMLLVIMLLGTLAACGSNEPLTDEEAKQAVMEYLGEDAKNVTEIHAHGLGETNDGQVCITVYATMNGKTYTYQVHATTGEILSVAEGGHSH